MSEKFIRLVDHDKLLEVIDSFKRKDRDIRSLVVDVFKGLWNSNRLHKSITTNIDFEVLKVSFPQFKEVIKYYQTQATISKRLKRPFTACPVLLLGDAGLGKTYFASELSALLGLPYFEISLATATANFAISGGDMQWARGQPGFIIKSLAKSEVANPVFLIDELDKASKADRYDPITPFYSLLEPHSAQVFNDEAINLKVDASHVIWMATANEEVRIHEPILSRFKRFYIKQPSPTEMLGVIDSIYALLRKRGDLEDLISPTLDLEIKKQIATLSPREVRLALDEAIMSAIFDERTDLIVADLPIQKRGAGNVGFI